MKYLCLIYADEKKFDETTADTLESVLTECREHTETLRGNGQLIAAERLEPTRTATTIRAGTGSASVTDGPFAETKEQLGGFYLIEAADLDEAIRIASDIPPGRFGSVEVRPVMPDASG